MYEYKPKRKELKELNDECLYENILKIWNEVGGTTRKQNTTQMTAKEREGSCQEREKKKSKK